jgi:hypothetical protein
VAARDIGREYADFGHASSLKGYELPPSSGNLLAGLLRAFIVFRPMRSTSARATRTFRPTIQLRVCWEQTVKQSTLLIW